MQTDTGGTNFFFFFFLPCLSSFCGVHAGGHAALCKAAYVPVERGATAYPEGLASVYVTPLASHKRRVRTTPPGHRQSSV